MFRPASFLAAALALAALAAVTACTSLDQDAAGDEPTAEELDTLSAGQIAIFASVATGKCIDAPTPWTGLVPPVTQQACSGGASQRFVLSPLGTSGFLMVENATGRCVDVEGTAATGYKLRRAACNLSTATTNTQRFLFGAARTTSKGTAYELLWGYSTGLCVEVPGALPADGLRLRLAPCGGATAQLWKVLLS